VVAVGVVVALIIGLVTDLARIDIAHAYATSDERVPMIRRIGSAAKGALVLTRRRLGRLGLEWAARALPSFVLFVVGWWIGGLFGGRGGGALFLLFVIHQVVIVARVALRASWIASALRLG
jgi:hypothetical protein